MHEPMHKYYDPREFDIERDPEKLLSMFAPRRRGCDGELLSPSAAAALPVQEQALLGPPQNVQTVEDYIAAGFDVNFTGPQAEGSRGGVEAAAAAVASVGSLEVTGDSTLCDEVAEDVFCQWLAWAEMAVGGALLVYAWAASSCCGATQWRCSFSGTRSHSTTTAAARSTGTTWV